MTTIIIDLVKRLVVADTRVTYMKGGKVVKYTKDSRKIFKSSCGKFIMTTSGNCKLSKDYIKNFCEVQTTDKGGVNTGDDANILIVNMYNSQTKHIYLKKRAVGIETKVEYFTGGTFLITGSGCEVATKLMPLLKDACRVVKYVAMKDKYTNDVLQVMEY